MNLKQILTNFVAKLNNNPNGPAPAERWFEIDSLEQRIMLSATQFSEMVSSDLPVEIFGNNGNDAILGTELDEFIDGGSGNDLLNGGEGNDELIGGGGSDTLIGGSGDDELRGESGNDILNAGTGFDAIYGGDGYDTVQISGNSSDYEFGILDNGKYEITGNDGSVLHINTHVYETNFLYESVNFSPEEIDKIVEAPAAVDAPVVVQAPDVDTTLLGGSGDDELRGGSGNDIINSGTGFDGIYGGDGYDTVQISGNSSDYEFGILDNGKYEITGNDGSVLHINTHVYETNFLYESVNFSPEEIDKIVEAPAAVDAPVVVQAPDVDTTLLGGSGDDELRGGSGNDIINSGTGFDGIYGGDGYDTVQISGNSSDYEFGILDNGKYEITGNDGNVVHINTDVEEIHFLYDSVSFSPEDIDQIVEAPVVAVPDFELLAGDTIADGTVIGAGSTVTVAGGSIGLSVDLSDGVLNIESGEVAVDATGIDTGFTNTNNVVNISGGTIGGSFQLFEGSELTMTGGEIGSFGVFDGSTADISGGTITRFPDIFDGGVVNISGGDIFSVRVFDGGEVNFIGSEFSIDGTPLALTPGETFVVDTRDVNLSGTLADGSFFETDLNTTFGDFDGSEPDGAGLGALVTVTIV